MTFQQKLIGFGGFKDDDIVLDGDTITYTTRTRVKTLAKIKPVFKSEDFFKQSILIEKLLANVATNGTQVEIKPHGWFYAKPIDNTPWWRRIVVAWRVLTGKSFAVHYKEDEIWQD